MKELHDLPEMSAGARALLDETRAMDEPSPGDRDRVKRAMLGAIAGGGALAATTAASSTAAAAGSTAAATAAATTAAATSAATAGVSLSIKIAAALLVAGAVGGTALVVTEPEHPTTRGHVAVDVAVDVPPEPAVEEAPVQPMPAPLVVEQPDTMDEPVIEAETLDEPPEIAAPAPSAPRTSRPAARAEPSVEPEEPSSLQAEVALLRRAQREIAAHDGAAALRHLEELTRRFPDGVMGEERDAARVFALCESGRRDEARAAARRFLDERPSSPLRARVAGACP